jgi:hypothetical protein
MENHADREVLVRSAIGLIPAVHSFQIFILYQCTLGAEVFWYQARFIEESFQTTWVFSGYSGFLPK